MRRLILLSLLLLSPFGLSDDEEELAKVKHELEELNLRLQQFHSEQSALEGEMRDQEVELSRLHREIYNTDREIGVSSARLDQLENQKSELEALSIQQEAAIRSDLVAMYKNGQEEPIKVLLNQEDPAKLSRMLVYYRYLLDARTEKIDAYSNTIEKLNTTGEEIAQQNLALEELKKKLHDQETSLNASLARRARLLERLESRILTAEQQIALREEDAQRLENLILDAIERIAGLAPPESYRPFSEMRGQFNWPVDGRLIHSYGSQRSGDLRWQGVVIRSNSGAEVNSIHHGRVVFADYMRGYGLLVIVDHEDGYMTLYGHNQSLFVEPGDWVTPDDQLALVGNTGGLTENGLYFEVRQSGKPVNPAQWCSST